MSVVEPRDSSCLLVFGLASNPGTSVGPLSSDVGFKETHLLVDPGLSLGHLPRGLARLELGQLAITRSLGFEPTSDIKGLELQFCIYFLPREPLFCSCHGTVDVPCHTVLGAALQIPQWKFPDCQ